MNYPKAATNGLALVCALLCLSLAGCAGPGFAAYVMKGPQVPALYELPAGKTLVVVDDPDRSLSDPNLPAVIATNIGFHLEKNDALKGGSIIPQDGLTTYAARLGDDYFTTAIDKVGRDLSADQVLHVQVRSASMRVTANYYRPTVTVEIKVINNQDGSRLFPVPKSDNKDPRSRPPGIITTVELPHQTADTGRRDTATLIARKLAEQAGLEIARLFFTHTKPDFE